jgi:hypothetical protein
MKGNDQSWVHVLRDKYMRKDGSDLGWLAKPDSSPLWKTICRLHPKVPEGVSWILGNGKRARFWQHCRVANCDPRLLEFAIDLVPEEQLQRTVCQFVSDASQWEWSVFDRFLPMELILKIAATFPPHGSAGREDIFIWKFTSNGEFSTNTAYGMLEDHKWITIYMEI